MDKDNAIEICVLSLEIETRLEMQNCYDKKQQHYLKKHEF